MSPLRKPKPIRGQKGPAPTLFRLALSGLLWVLSLIALAVMASRFAPSIMSNGRLIPEAAAFVPWFALVSLGVLMVAGASKRKALCVVSLLCLMCQIGWHLGFFVAANGVNLQDEGESSTTSLRIMTLNSCGGDADAQQIASIVRDEQVKVLAMQEVSSVLLKRLSDAGLDQVLPSRVLGAASPYDNGGINVIFSATTMDDTNESALPVTASAAPAATLNVGGRSIRVLSVHPSSPKTGRLGFWNQSLNNLGAAHVPNATYLIMGDFNSTWDHSRFRKMLGDNLVDASQQAGEGLHFTYPSEPGYAMLPVPPMIEIDHLVYSKERGMSVRKLETIHVNGTDHLGLLGTLEVG